MAYYVIKGPNRFSQYLCVLESFPSPQWWQKGAARRFPDPQSARAWLKSVQEEWRDSGSYDGRVVRVNTSADLRAERLRLRQQANHVRVLVLDEVEHAIMNGPIVRGGAAAQTLNEVLEAVRALRRKPLRPRTAESNGPDQESK